MKREPNIWTEHLEPGEWRPESPEGSVYAVMHETALEIPRKTALVFENNSIKYEELMLGIQKAAQGMIAMGLSKGDIISVITPNIPQAVETIYAANMLGVVCNMIHPGLSVNEIRDSVNKTESKAIFILDQIYPKIKKVVWEGCDPEFVLYRIKDALPFYAKPVYSMRAKIPVYEEGEKLIYWNTFIHEGKAVSIGAETLEGKEYPDGSIPESDETALIMYSGGTTGTPKGVMLTNRNFNSMYTILSDICGFPVHIDMDLKTVALVPLFHGFGFGVCVHAMLCYGLRIYLMPMFDFEKTIRMIFGYRMQCVYVVPAFFEAMSRSVEIESGDPSFLRLLVSGGDRLPERVSRRMDRYLEESGSSARLREAYGQTECVCSCAINPYFAMKEGSFGIPYPDTDVRIFLPDTTEEAPDGTEGEICVSGPIVMKGYFKDPEATAAALKTHEDGKIWLHTGDMGRRDSDGYFYYVQRMSRMIISSGYNIYLPQVEEAAKKCEEVKDCVAVGIDDRALGKRAALAVVLRGPETPETEEKIRKACRENLAEYSQPGRIIVMDEIPHTSVGKVDYKSVDAMF